MLPGHIHFIYFLQDSFPFSFLSLSLLSCLQSLLLQQTPFFYPLFALLHNSLLPTISSSRATKMVNWKSAEAKDRLIASLFAGNPGLKVHFPHRPQPMHEQPDHMLTHTLLQLDYNSMATMFGQGASYDSVEHQFRRFRKLADEMKAEAQARGVDISRAGAVPRTPRGPRNRVSKSTPSSSSSKRGKKFDFDKEDVLDSPSKGKGKAAAAGNSNVICLSPEPPFSKPEAATEGIKAEAGARFLPLTPPAHSSLPPVKREQQDTIDLDAESVAPADYSVKVKTESGMSVICDDEDSDGTV